MTDLNLSISLSKELEQTESEISNYQVSKDDVIVGGVFDPKTFNQKLDKLNELKRKRSKLRDKLKLSKMVQQLPTDHNKQSLTKDFIINDFYQMLDEFKGLKKINVVGIENIINKNYRKLIILIILLIILIVMYVSV